MNLKPTNLVLNLTKLKDFLFSNIDKNKFASGDVDLICETISTATYSAIETDDFTNIFDAENFFIMAGGVIYALQDTINRKKTIRDNMLKIMIYDPKQFAADLNDYFTMFEQLENRFVQKIYNSKLYQQKDQDLNQELEKYISTIDELIIRLKQ